MNDIIHAVLNRIAGNRTPHIAMDTPDSLGMALLLPHNAINRQRVFDPN